jgi:hypothetical protein
VPRLSAFPDPCTPSSLDPLQTFSVGGQTRIVVGAHYTEVEGAASTHPHTMYVPTAPAAAAAVTEARARNSQYRVHNPHADLSARGALASTHRLADASGDVAHCSHTLVPQRAVERAAPALHMRQHAWSGDGCS